MTVQDPSQLRLDHFVSAAVQSETADPSIPEQVKTIFVHHPHLQNRKLHCRSVEDRVVIEGEVHSFFEKQLAQEALRGIEGLQVENQINVVQF